MHERLLPQRSLVELRRADEDVSFLALRDGHGGGPQAAEVMRGHVQLQGQDLLSLRVVNGPRRVFKPVPKRPAESESRLGG